MANVLKHQSVSVRLLAAEICAVPFSFACGAVSGLVYGKSANLPIVQLQKIWSAWNAFQNALIFLTFYGVKNKPAKAFAITIISSLLTVIGINELKKRTEMSQKMMIFCLAAQTLHLLGTLILANKIDKDAAVLDATT